MYSSIITTARKVLLSLVFSLLPLLSHADTAADSVIVSRCLQSLVSFMHYAEGLYCAAGVNECGDSIGYFRAYSGGESNEDGVRTNADIAMVTAFVAAEAAQGRAVLPEDVTPERLKQISIRALRYALSTHRANATALCTDGKLWGSALDNHQWESSLWSMSVAWAWHFASQWHGCTAADRQSLARLLQSEARFLVNRPVPTGFLGDTKAEENGWDSNLLATALAFGDTGIAEDSLRNALMRYSLNCYTVAADRHLAPELYEGANLFDDFTLQNHDYFHTSYQNVVMQELAESILTLHLLSSNTYPPTPTINPQSTITHHQTPITLLTWHWQEVWDNVLAWLALADGELAMPNGNDWSMFLYDQLPAYAAMSTIMQNADALMLENRCLDQLLSRQQTTPDGSYMLNADIGPRRMGVTAHRVLATLLMHRLFPATGLRPSSWQDFCSRHRRAVLFSSQNIVRGMTESRFACFSASEGLHNCAAIIVPNSIDECKISIPYREGFGGNIIGTPSEMPHIININAREDGSWTVLGSADGEPFCIWATPSNAVMVIGRPVFLALADDPFTNLVGRRLTVVKGKRWANIGNSIGIVTAGSTAADFLLEHKGIVNSINTSVIRADNTPAAVYFCGTDSLQTARIARHTTLKRHTVPTPSVSRKGKTRLPAYTLTTRDTDGTLRRLTLICDPANPQVITKTN